MMLNGTKPAPEPGIYENVAFEEYLAWDAINNSSLSRAARSMAHFRHADPPKETQALKLGSLAHAGTLEPLSIIKRYVVMPPFEEQVRRPDGTRYTSPKASGDYKRLVGEFERANADKTIVDETTYDMMVGIVESIMANERARSFLAGAGPAEVSIVWDDPSTGLRCKARVDRWRKDAQLLADLKTTIDASDFERSIFRYGYHRQGAFYSDGMLYTTGAEHEFGIVAAEKVKPYGVRAATLHEETIDAGRDEYKRLLRQIARSIESDTWPGYEDPTHWRLPEWALAQASDSPAIKIAGQTVSL